MHPPSLFVAHAGWSCNTEFYYPIFERLASHGFVVVSPIITDVLANPFFDMKAIDFKDQTARAQMTQMTQIIPASRS